MADPRLSPVLATNGAPSARPSACVPKGLEQFLTCNLIHPEDWDLLAAEKRQALSACTDSDRLLNLLVDYGLVTDYQAGRIEAGTTFGLTLGNYRILDRLGAGGMGVVFRAEHVRLRKIVAIKVLPVSPDNDPRLLSRFFTEIRAIAQLQHPNIVGAMDAGECPAPDGRGTVLHFCVMEYVPGEDLERFVHHNGTLPVAKACDLMHQIASALAEANKHGLVHRDIKPSNIQLTPEGQAKLLDFGLARHFKSGMTEAGTLLGTLDYMAPEQIQDARSVDIRADLYGLGGVLYWCLTGQSPFPSKGNMIQDLTARLNQPPPPLVTARPDAPAELERVVHRLMAMNPADRYSTPETVMTALLPYLAAEGRPALATDPTDVTGAEEAAAPVHRVLLVDDQSSIRSFCRLVLQAEGLECDEAEGGRQALEMIRANSYDLVLLDINMPDLCGTEVCRLLREDPPYPNLKIIMASGGSNGDVMAQMLLSGADDFITKPFSVMQLQSRVKAALRFKEAQDRSEVLNRHLLAVNQELSRNLGSHHSQIVDARGALVLGLTHMVQHRASESSAHLTRIQKYCRCLAEEASRFSAHAGEITPQFIDLLESCAPLHDIGKVGLPDHILLKPGKLDAEERVQMQAHTLIGAATLAELGRAHGSALGFLPMATDIVRHHHERWDGKGYPDRLAGEAIPLAARIVAVADVYDALRSRRPYKAPVSHDAALQVMMDPAAGQFDPTLLQALQRVAPHFERIFKETPD